MASPVIQVKRGLYSNLPALKSGEPGFTTDKYDLFVGLDETLGNNQFFGSGRYWEREDGTNAAQLKLVDKDGSNGINLQVPDTTAGIGTWILPNSNTGSQYGLLAIASTSGDERTLEWTSITTNSFDATTLVIESEGISSNDSDTQIPTTAAVKDYVDTQITAQDLDFAGDSGTGAVDRDSQSLSIVGTVNEIETSGSGQTLTIGLPNDVTVSNNLTVSNNVTVQGNLTVNGTTTQVNTSEVSVYDRTITLGIQTGSTPTTTTWDLGVMMQYGDAGVAKTAGVIWEYSNERFQFSANSNNPSSGTDTTAPQITVATFAPIEIGSLWVNDCAGQSQVISCTGSTRNLENITVDAGSF